MAEQDIVFDWGEKDRDQARQSWKAYQRLSKKVQSEIGHRMVDLIASPLCDLVGKVLDPGAGRELERVELEIHTNLGEVKCISCSDVEEAISILQDFDFNLVFDDRDAVALTDPPPLIDE
jgi:nitrogen-specific signal transduction histidine kinase